jgi:hypothetical protein
MLAKLDHLGQRTHEVLDVADLNLQLRMDRIEARIAEFAEVERLAEAAYLKTHPEAHAGVEAMKTSVYMACHEARLDARINKRDSES